ncbi:hypothetical protein Bca52824_028414 [Brassica carinata]|uniref:Uncharacterized protein n=1 Tax=Brassica carinata TaxID=52824 RepID=A0A8X7VCF2_BRACI|nr:hypothetical protein Bca52824_028414 [Brassica carinata]
MKCVRFRDRFRYSAFHCAYLELLLYICESEYRVTRNEIGERKVFETIDESSEVERKPVPYRIHRTAPEPWPVKSDANFFTFVQFY